MPEIPFSLRKLSPSAIEVLTQILLPHQEIPTKLLAQLPKEIRHPVPFQRHITHLIKRNIPDPVVSARVHCCSSLCSAHKPLNGQIIAFLLDALRCEISTKLSHLIADSKHTSQLTQTIIANLQVLHALWLPATDYIKIFAQLPLPTWAFVANECEACILANIPRSDETMACLLAAIWSRRKRRRERPSFAAFVEGWISWGSHPERVRAKAKEWERVMRHDRVDARARRKGKAEEEVPSEIKRKKQEQKQIAAAASEEERIIDAYVSSPSDVSTPSYLAYLPAAYSPTLLAQIASLATPPPTPPERPEVPIRQHSHQRGNSSANRSQPSTSEFAHDHPAPSAYVSNMGNPFRRNDEQCDQRDRRNLGRVGLLDSTTAVVGDGDGMGDMDPLLTPPALFSGSDRRRDGADNRTSRSMTWSRFQRR